VAPAERMAPKAAELTVKAGALRLMKLKAFVNSPRACSCIFSRSLKIRKRPMSMSLTPGALRTLRPSLPSVPAAGTAKAAVLNHALLASGRDRLGLR
jgi:hypothetical protein